MIEMRKVGAEARRWNVVQNSRAVLAAGRCKMGITEEKERMRGVAWDVVVKECGRDDCSESPSTN